jgi:hypothetical protein
MGAAMLAVSMTDCKARNESGEDPLSGGAAIDRAVATIAASPAWSDLAPDDEAGRREILASLDSLARYDLATLRAAVSRYVEERHARNAYDVAAMSRLYVLDRYLFAVPPRRPLGERRFAAFAGIPHDETTVDEWWPLSRSDAGHWTLTGRFRGYTGEDYQALEEFDYFNERFGRRKEEP